MQKNLKTKIIIVAVVIIIIAITVINSHKKESHISVAGSITTLTSTDRLFSVANVYYTEDGKKVEVWFMESQMIFEFSIDSPNARSNFEMLKYAEANNVPVNVRLNTNIENQIDLIIPSTPEQIANFKTELSKREKATEVSPPTHI